MRTHLAAATAAVVAAIGPARAETRLHHRADVAAPSASRIGLGSPGDRVAIDRVTIALAPEAERTTATITIALSTAARAARAVRLAIEVPAGTVVVGFALGDADARLAGEALDVDLARTWYRRVVTGAHRVDPGLVEWGDGDRLDVQLYPLSATTPVVAELRLELPRAATLVVDPGAQTIGALDVALEDHPAHHAGVRAPVVVELGADRVRDHAWMAAAAAPPRTPIDRARALYAGPRGGFVERTVVIACGGFGVADRRSGLDKAIIRREIRRHLGAIQHCYDRALVRRPTLAGTIMLELDINEAGWIDHAAAIDGLADPSVASCIVDEATGWRFPDSTEAVRVNYPFELKHP